MESSSPEPMTFLFTESFAVGASYTSAVAGARASPREGKVRTSRRGRSGWRQTRTSPMLTGCARYARSLFSGSAWPLGVARMLRLSGVRAGPGECARVAPPASLPCCNAARRRARWRAASVPAVRTGGRRNRPANAVESASSASTLSVRPVLRKDASLPAGSWEALSSLSRPLYQSSLSDSWRLPRTLVATRPSVRLPRRKIAHAMASGEETNHQ